MTFRDLNMLHAPRIQKTFFNELWTCVLTNFNPPYSAYLYIEILFWFISFLLMSDSKIMQFPQKNPLGASSTQ